MAPQSLILNTTSGLSHALPEDYILDSERIKCAQRRRKKNRHLELYLDDKVRRSGTFSAALVALLFITLVTGCTANADKSEISAKKHSEDAWENRIEKIMDDQELAPVEIKGDQEQAPLEQQYKQEQGQLTNAFEDCFAKVFAGKTFDGGIPWKSEGQGYRDIISVNDQGVAAWWTISRRSKSCSPLTTPIQDYQSARIGQEIKFDPSPFNPSSYRIGKWMLENNEKELCWYERSSTLKGVSRRCYQHLPTFVPG